MGKRELCTCGTFCVTKQLLLLRVGYLCTVIPQHRPAKPLHPDWGEEVLVTLSSYVGRGRFSRTSLWADSGGAKETTDDSAVGSAVHGT